MTDQPTISLAQWCAYLPYGLQLNGDFLYKGFRPRLVLDNNTNSLLNGLTISDAKHYNAKPLLLPMNEANKEPIKSLCKSLGFTPEYSMFLTDYNHKDTIIHIKHDLLPYDIVQALLAAHYDIFNLIPQGLALPIE